QESVAQGSAAQESTAQESTAQETAAQEFTAQSSHASSSVTAPRDDAVEETGRMPDGPRDRVASRDGLREAAIAGKPVAPFAIEHEVRGVPAVGLPFELQIVVRPRVPIEDIEVR